MQYLAYGSNMLGKRIKKRVPTATNPRIVTLPGRTVVYQKSSKDGSAKCDLVASSATAYGVLWEIDRADLPKLDVAEGCGYGYRREPIDLRIGAEQVRAFVYVADREAVSPGLRPYDWYRDIVVAGAKEHGLPELYVRDVLDVPADADPDRARSARERGVL